MHKKVKFLIWVLVIILVIFSLNFFQKEVKTFFYSVSLPFQKVLWGVGDSVSDFFGGIVRVKSLKEEIDELKLKNQELIAEIAKLEGLGRENEVLREALGLELQKDFKLFLTQIISKDISQDFILIDKGSDDGIKENMPVITQEKVLLGRIGELYNKFSKVMLISSKKSSFDADIKERDVYGIVKGKGGLKIFLDLIPKDKEIFQGDIVVTSSLGGVFPAGLLVGEVIEVKKNDVESFQQAEIRSAFDIRKINYLFVINEN